MPAEQDRSGRSARRPRVRRRKPSPPGPPTRAEQIAEAIAAAILDGTFPPGHHLDEHEMAARYAVSRTPIRDALRLLAGTGLTEARPNTGTRVRRLSAAEVASLFTAMGEVEASCARLCAALMTGPEREDLAALHARMGELAEADDRAAYVEANRTFHGLIYAGAHNAPLSEMAISLRRRLTPYRTAQFLLAGRLGLSHAEHGRVVRAVLARDGSGANAAMLAHMSVVEEAFEAQDAPRAEGRSEERAGAVRGRGGAGAGAGGAGAQVGRRKDPPASSGG